jgi:carboxyl-terminal processing protease
MFAALDAARISRETLDLDAGVIRMNVWMAPLSVRFAEAVDRFRGLDGIVVDLRGNPGGLGGMVMGVSGHFLDERISLGTMRMREQKLEFVSNPQQVSPAGLRVEPYGGPLAILIDEMSASTSEVFAGGMQAVGRARVIGRRSAGMALPALMERLPNQDVLYHAGAPIEKLGVTPDITVPLLRGDLLAGRDADLEEALRWIAETRGGWTRRSR